MLKVENGSFSYVKDKKILEAICLDIHPGEVISILGQNGIGKTTFIKCMINILKWNKGKTFLNEVNLIEINHKDIFKKVSYVPQAKNTTFSYTVLEMVVMGRNAHLSEFSSPSKKDYEIAEECLKQVKLSNVKNELCSHLSGGQLQMVLIARALATKPEILILDEPESNLDFKNQLMILDIIESLSKNKDVSIIFNTHFPANALKVSDKTLLLVKNGKNIFGKTHEIVTKENMKFAFDVDVYIKKILIKEKYYYAVIPY